MGAAIEPESLILRAGYVVLAPGAVKTSVAVEVKGGLIVGWRPVPTASLTEAERTRILTPGLVNAHTHLDLGALRGAVPADDGFTGWVRRLVAAREALDGPEIAHGVRASARAALESGTTTVLDIDSCGETAAALESESTTGLRAYLLREVLDGSPRGESERTQAAVALARGAIRGGHGVSPHGTHSVGDLLMAAMAQMVRDSRTSGAAAGSQVLVGVHWAETEAESEWLLRGEGPFSSWLGPSPGVPGTERLERAGLLAGALLIHGNDPQPGEAARIAAAGCTLVHCPGSHLFFGREPFPAQHYLDHGVRLALGTDSWASNRSLDMRREMRLARETLGLDAVATWRMATENGAEMHPDPRVTGRIEAGAVADLVEFRGPDPSEFERSCGSWATTVEGLFDLLTLGEPTVSGVWVSGCPVMSITG